MKFKRNSMNAKYYQDECSCLVQFCVPSYFFLLFNKTRVDIEEHNEIAGFPRHGCALSFPFVICPGKTNKLLGASRQNLLQ